MLWSMLPVGLEMNYIPDWMYIFAKLRLVVLFRRTEILDGYAIFETT